MDGGKYAARQWAGIRALPDCASSPALIAPKRLPRTRRRGVPSGSLGLRDRQPVELGHHL